MNLDELNIDGIRKCLNRISNRLTSVVDEIEKSLLRDGYSSSDTEAVIQFVLSRLYATYSARIIKRKFDVSFDEETRILSELGEKIDDFALKFVEDYISRRLKGFDLSDEGNREKSRGDA